VNRTTVAAAIAAILAALAPAAVAQDDDRLPNGRRPTAGKTTSLAFKNVTVERLIPFIVESTGKVVVPRQEIMSRRITILNDAEIPQDEALDLVFLALQQEGIAVVETMDVITLRDIAEIDRQDVPVVPSGVSVLGRTETAVAGAGWGLFIIMAMLGGGMVPLIAMPGWMRQLSSASPVKWAILSLEGAIWRDFTLMEMMLPAGILVGVGVVTFAAGVRIFSLTDR
jgi:hypothetical protein